MLECDASPRLALSKALVRRGRRTVLQVESLAIASGEVLAVLGPNGAGKSTLLRVCGFLEAPAEGQVLVDGRAVAGTPLWARRRATMLLQQPVLFRGTVRGNVELGLRLHGVARGLRRARAAEWLTRFGVAHLADRSARALSGGEAQRVALARALAFEPQIVLLDEPFAALDQPTREILVEMTIAELRRLGSTTIFVTHDRQEALRLADRALVLVDGAIRQIGAPAELRAHPVDALVATYMGAATDGAA